MKMSTLTCGRIILLFGTILALLQELWYVDTGVELLSVGIFGFLIPIIIMVTGIIIILHTYRSNND